MRDNGRWDLGCKGESQEKVKCRFSGKWNTGCEISRGIRMGPDSGLNNGEDTVAIT